MSHLAKSAIFAAMIALTAPAVAQTAAAPHSNAAGNASAGEMQMQPDQIRASKFIGSTVYDVQDRNIGNVKDLLFDKSGRIDAAVIDVGSFLGLGGKLVAVPLRDIRADNNRLTLNMSKEQLKSAKAFKFDETESTGTSVRPGERNNNENNNRR